MLLKCQRYRYSLKVCRALIVSDEDGGGTKQILVQSTKQASNQVAVKLVSPEFALDGRAGWPHRILPVQRLLPLW